VSGLERERTGLRTGDRDFTGSGQLLSKGVSERGGPLLRLDSAPVVQLIARDNYVVETAGKIEQMQASIRLLARDVSELANKVGALHDTASQDHRWHAFQDNERRARETKFDETLRICRDLKARLDRIEPRAGGDYHSYNSFEAVSRKLAELEQHRETAQRVERKVTLRAWLFCGALVLASSIIVASHVFAG
jgi:hypothetical protein